MEQMNQQMSDVQATAPSPEPLCTLKPARFKAFVRLTRQLVKLHGPRPICIENSRLFQPIGHPNFWVEIDLCNILEDAGSKAGAASPKGKTAIAPGISFAFQATTQDIDGLAGLAGKSKVDVWDLDNELLFANANTPAGLQKPARPMSFPQMNLPLDENKIGEEIAQIDLADLRLYVGKASYVTLLGYHGQLEQIQVPGKRPYTLYAPSGPALIGQKPDVALISQNFLDLAGELQLSLSIYQKGDVYWLKTSSRPSLINNLTTYECLCAEFIDQK